MFKKICFTFLLSAFGMFYLANSAFSADVEMPGSECFRYHSYVYGWEVSEGWYSDDTNPCRYSPVERPGWKPFVYYLTSAVNFPSLPDVSNVKSPEPVHPSVCRLFKKHDIPIHNPYVQSICDQL